MGRRRKRGKGHGKSKAAHPPLDRSKEQIRLLSLETDETFRLDVFSICEAPEYVALSYTWGSPDELETITLNGKPFAIRRNLPTALATLRRHLREATVLWKAQKLKHRDNLVLNRKALFWIDAICIDQQNDEEKTHQVNRMDKIFSGAEYIIAWLGTECEGVLAWLETVQVAKDEAPELECFR